MLEPEKTRWRTEGMLDDVPLGGNRGIFCPSENGVGYCGRNHMAISLAPNRRDIFSRVCLRHTHNRTTFYTKALYSDAFSSLPFSRLIMFLPPCSTVNLLAFPYPFTGCLRAAP